MSSDHVEHGESRNGAAIPRWKHLVRPGIDASRLDEHEHDPPHHHGQGRDVAALLPRLGRAEDVLPVRGADAGSDPACRATLRPADRLHPFGHDPRSLSRG